VPEPGSLRVLVVDDMADVRMLMRRVLARCGYQVDEASSGPEARALGPSRYDVVVVDANLGAERGTDLIEAMLAEDPAAAARCLLVTGGGPGQAVPGTGYLAKPFRPDELVAAVHARHEAATAAGHVIAAATGTRPEPAAAPAAAPAPASGPPSGPAPAASPGSGWPLLALIRRLRAAERAAVAGLLHDGPVQELTAAMLTLEVLASQAPGDLAPRFGEIRSQLGTASRPVRELIDDWAPVLGAAPGLAAAVRQRTGWLPYSGVLVECAGSMPGLTGLPDLAEVIELALFLAAGHVPPGQASVLIRADGGTTEIQLVLTAGEPAELSQPGEPSQPGPPGGTGDPAGLRDALAALAAALGGTARTETGGRPWRAAITLPVT
jgi:CheY-like chemotaxis protein